MAESPFQQLVENASLLLALAFLFDVAALRWRIGNLTLRRAPIGLLIGGIGIGIMLIPWTFTPGIVFDTRSVLLSISGLFFGAAPTLVAMAVTTAFRLYQGGGGALTGVSVILVTGTLGIAWRHFCRRPLAEMTWLELYAFGIVTHLVMLGLMFTLPWATALRVLATISLPVLALYPLATALLGVLMVNRLRRVRTEATLRDNERRLRGYLDNAPYGVFVADPQGAYGEVNPAACRITGYTEAELLAMRLPDLLMPEFKATLQRFQQVGPTDRVYSESMFRHKDGTPRWWAVAATRLSDTRLLGFVEDITARKQAEAQAAAAQVEQARLLAQAEQAHRVLLSVVEEQQRTEAALQRRNAYLAALQDTTLELIGQLDLDTLLENVVKRAGLLADTAAGFLDLLDPATGRLEPRVGMGALAESLQYTVRLGEGVAGAVWQTGQPLVVNDYDGWPGRIGEFSRNTLRAVIAVPLLSGGQVMGVLGLAYDHATERTFDQGAVEILTQFARLATLAIDNAHLFAAADRSQHALLSMVEDQKAVEEALRESNRRLSALNRVGSALAESLELPAIYRTAYEQVGRLVDAPCLGISLYDSATRTLRAGYMFSDGELLAATSFPPLAIDLDQAPRGRARAILTEQPEVVNQMGCAPSESVLVVGESYDGSKPRSALYVPIVVRGHVIGLLETQSYRDYAYNEAEIDLLRPVANQIGLAMENARLFAELQAERDLLAQRVRDRTAQLEAANQELEAFAYSVSHDLRAPLRALDGFSAALLADYPDKLDEQGQHYLTRIQEASRRMGQLINDLLNLSRVTRRTLSRQTVDLSGLVREIVAELQGRAAPGRAVEFSIADGLLVEGDPQLLRIALENLLYNAEKFSSTRTPARIEVGVTEQADPRVYFVRDNGVGFDMAYADKLFVPFQRLHSVQEFPGTGIGLVTVQRIITRHGGRIWPEAVVDQGATFYFTLGGA